MSFSSTLLHARKSRANSKSLSLTARRMDITVWMSSPNDEVAVAEAGSDTGWLAADSFSGRSRNALGGSVALVYPRVEGARGGSRGITKEYKDLIVQINDNDGEFLLIEAAEVLPSWANPETTENRVYIYNSEIHIIPPDIADLDKHLTIQEALIKITQCPSRTCASPEIQQSINKRIENYLLGHVSNIHRAIVTLPVSLASLLKLKPTLIAPIVIAYCNYDAIDAKICKNITLKDHVSTTISFTKCLYAMLMHSKLLVNIKNIDPRLKDDKKSCLGLKLCCGFEILVSHSSKDTFATKEWNIYLTSLKNNEYFKGNIEGSKKYSELLEKAKKYFIATECSYINSYLTNDIQCIMATDHYKKQCDDFRSNPTEDLIEDSDDWLQVHPDQLNELLSSRYGKQQKFKQDDIITPHTVTNKLASFFNQKSDFEGLESSDLEKSKDDDKIDFDCKVFTDTLKNILDFVVPEDNWELDSGTDLSEYGSDDDIMPDLKKSHQDSPMDIELKEKLASDIIKGNATDIPRSTFTNITQSIKEEQGASGPASNLLNTLGINKKDLCLDSDDDDDYGLRVGRYRGRERYRVEIERGPEYEPSSGPSTTP
ncbi:Protein ecdysoneless [Eumeta japonica]|uniref:Protein ecdysoneless n=1 Tax=Eumeta variegata TaxID=151549 RepID=A0A4C1U0S8_EUMVA|nr:Protein ecdysoneless [Eumeta japonica]